MSTKEKFINDLKKLIDKYNISIYTRDCTGTPGDTINNMPNIAITGVNIPIPDEDVRIIISSKELYDALGFEKEKK